MNNTQEKLLIINPFDLFLLNRNETIKKSNINQESVSLFNQLISKHKVNIKITQRKTQEQGNEDWWLMLFSKLGIEDVNLHEDFLLINFPFIQDLMKEFESEVEINNNTIGLDVYLTKMKRQLIEQNNKKKEYDFKYSLYLGINKRKEIIPKTEYEYYEYLKNKEKVIENIIDLPFDGNFNQAILDVIEKKLT